MLPCRQWQTVSWRHSVSPRHREWVPAQRHGQSSPEFGWDGQGVAMRSFNCTELVAVFIQALPGMARSCPYLCSSLTVWGYKVLYCVVSKCSTEIHPWCQLQAVQQLSSQLRWKASLIVWNTEISRREQEDRKSYNSVKFLHKHWLQQWNEKCCLQFNL